MSAGGANMNSKKVKKPTGPKHFPVAESVSIALKIQLDKFMTDDNETELKFPTFLSAQERGFIHVAVSKLGLKSKSRGKGVNRYITVYKRNGSTIIQNDAKIVLDSNMRCIIMELYNQFPLTNKEKEDLNMSPEKERSPQLMQKTLGQLNNGVAQIPNTTYNPELVKFREKLPVYEHRQEVINAIIHNQVIIVAGATGSGKTTQIPQLVLDHCQEHKLPARVYCTQPRRISAVTVAERVAFERMEKIGQTIGYQIRLESRVSPRTLLTYCTNGVLLRTLMAGDSALNGVSHIFVDEVHERDKFSDFLLTALRDALPRHKDLRLVLMSATIDTHTFSRYFGNCPVISIPGRLHEVKRYYLEDVLSMINYSTPKMKAIEKDMKNKQRTPTTYQSYLEAQKQADESSESDSDVIDATLQADMDEFLEECLNEGTPESFSQLQYMFSSEGVRPDCAHSRAGHAALHAAAAHARPDLLRELLRIGADPSIKDKNGKTAYDYAVEAGHTECANILSSLNTVEEYKENKQEDNTDTPLLENYLLSVSEDLVDHELIAALVKYLHLNMPRGAILVFLPGYDDMVAVRDSIGGVERMLLLLLHSNMAPHDQRRAFLTPPATQRKVVLSTNVAETSVTIDDVVYVVDSAKVKEKYYESGGACSLRCVWASAASVVQRAGRAGRLASGHAYLLASRARAATLPPIAPPELLRTPLHTLCLHAKLLAPPAAPVAAFLARAPDPPPFLAVRAAVALLKTIGALSPVEDLTELGRHLVDLTVDPRLGKMLLYACVLKCLDPVLTIVCALADREPFRIAPTPEARKRAAAARKQLAGDTYSDHMILLRAFQAWQAARAAGTERAFCQRTYICGPGMEAVQAQRARLLAQLRALGLVKARPPADIKVHYTTQLRALGLVKARPPADIKDVNTNSDKWHAVKAALVSGLYPSLARVDRGAGAGGVLRTAREPRVLVHPGSALRATPPANLPADWLVFEEGVRAGHCVFIRCCTLVTNACVALCAGRAASLQQRANPAGLSSDSDSDNDARWAAPAAATLVLDDWLSLSADAADALKLYFLRQKLSALVARRLGGAGGGPRPPHDDHVLAAVLRVLAIDDQNHGLVAPPGVGVRPRPMPPPLAPPSSAPAPAPAPAPARYLVLRAADNTDLHTYTIPPTAVDKINQIRQEGASVVIFVISSSGRALGAGAARDSAVDWLPGPLAVPAHAIRHISNSLAGGARVSSARDCTEICSSAARALLAVHAHHNQHAAGQHNAGQHNTGQHNVGQHNQRRRNPRPIQKHQPE